MHIYSNNQKNWEFGKEAPQIFFPARVPLFIDKTRVQEKKYGVKLTIPKLNSSGCLSIILSLVLLCSLPAYARILLDDVMTDEQMRLTGVDKLNFSQQMALEDWLNDNFALKGMCGGDKEAPTVLTLNHHQGLFLQFSNAKTYQIAPEDRYYAAYWMTPFPAEFRSSGDSEYPILIVNLYSNTAVRGKEVSTDDILKEEVDAHKTPAKPQPINPVPKTPSPRPRAPRNPNRPPELELNLQ